MADIDPIQTYSHLAQLTIERCDIVTTAGSLPVQLLASIYCELPSFDTYEDITTQFASPDEPAAITAGIIPDITGQTRIERIKSLLEFWSPRRSALWSMQKTVIVLCPAFAENTVRRGLPESPSELILTHSLNQALSALNDAAQKAAGSITLLTLDSLIDLAEFKLNNSPLCHNLNPEGLIPSEGITATYFVNTGTLGHVASLNSEPFYAQAESEPTQALWQLYESFTSKPSAILSNHEASQNKVHEWFRFHHEITTAGQPAIPVTSIRNTFGDTGLNDLGLLLALTHSNASHANTPTAMMLFQEHQRMMWPMSLATTGAQP